MKHQQLLPLALLALAVTASADGFYGVGELTHSRDSLDRSHFDHALTANGASGLSSSDKGNSNQFRIQGGYRFNQYFAIEGGYIDFGKTKYTANYLGGSAQGNLKAGGLDMAALVSLPLNENFSVFGKAGFVDAKVKSTLSATAPAGLATSNVSANVVRPLLGVGATYKLTQNVDLRADYDHVSGLGKSEKSGKMNSNMLSMGMVYNF